MNCTNVISEFLWSIGSTSTTYVHHSVPRGCLDKDAISRRDDLGMKGGSIAEQAIVGIALKLLDIRIIIRARHDV